MHPAYGDGNMGSLDATNVPEERNVSVEEDKALVRRFVEAQANADLEALDELLAPDFVDERAPAFHLPPRPSWAVRTGPRRCFTQRRGYGVLGSLCLGLGPMLHTLHQPDDHRGYDSLLTRERLRELGLGWEISGKGKPTPHWATYRWVVERTSSWHNAHKKLLWCTERVGKVIDFWVAFSEVVIIVRRLIREGWARYRWEG